MSKGATCRLRPTKQGDHVELKDIFKIYIPQATLKALHLMNGDICQLERPNGEHVMGRAAIAPSDVAKDVVQVTQAFKEMHGLSYEESHVLKHAESTVELVKSVTVVETSTEGRGIVAADAFESGFWTGVLFTHLTNCRFIAAKMILDNMPAKSQDRSFRITEITTLSGNSATDGGLFRFTQASEVTIMSEGLETQCRNGQLEVDFSGISGLERQLALLKKNIERFSPSRQYPRRGLGILLHGPSGTGKTLLLERIARSSWKRVLRPKCWATGTNTRSAPKEIEEAFVEASRHQPSLIILDDLELLLQGIDEHNAADGSLVKAIYQGFDTIRSSQVLVIAGAKNVRSVPALLRQPFRFQKEIYMPIPDAKVRTEILRGLLALENVDIAEDLLQSFGYRTHGYNGNDLFELREEAIMNSEDREPNQILHVSSEDMGLALQEVRPSAMNEVFLDVPKTRWTDVAGQQGLKEALKEAIEWPLKLPEEMKMLGCPPSKGMLLYGPPGCSKTLMAAAIANETGLNFLAVKGAQVLNMYVGESERNIRDIFDKARAAQPSIVFFDEVEAIGAARQDRGSGVNTLSTLLNELDGIESMTGVFVLAATNQPWTLDPALIRPGRLDQTVYVPLPDEATRRDMFELRLKNTKYAADVDVDWLAKNSEGCSGAEIVEACRAAGMKALREAQRARLPKEHMQVCQSHYVEVMKEMSKRTTVEMIERFKAWSDASKMRLEARV